MNLLYIWISAGEMRGVSADMIGSHEFTPSNIGKPCTFTVTRGDYSALMKLVTDNLKEASVSLRLICSVLPRKCFKQVFFASNTEAKT